MINANNMVDKSRPAAWSKLKAVDHVLSLKGVESSTNESSSNSINITNKADNENNVTGSNNGSINSNIDHNSSRPIAHSRSSSGERTYDYVLYIDMDVVIMDLDRRLEDFLDAATKRTEIHTKIKGDGGGATQPAVDFLMTEDWKGDPSTDPGRPEMVGSEMVGITI